MAHESTRFPVVHTVVSGSPLDGVRIYAVALAEARLRAGRPTGCFDLTDPRARRLSCDVVHVHLTDRLLTDAPQEWNSLFDLVRRRRRTLAITLHDIPQPREGADRYVRRCGATRSIAAQADVVIVNSESERRSCVEMGITPGVVAHPVFPVSAPSTRPNRRARTLVVAGFVHPGKGIAEFVEALGDVRGGRLAGWQLRLVGEVAARHRGYLREVARRAVGAGLDFHHTGPVGPDRWHRELFAACIPVAPHLHMSASGSILSWAAHGRRPVVSAHPFTRELLDERPGSVTVVDDATTWKTTLETSERDDDPHLVDTAGWRTPHAAVEAFDALIHPRSGGTTARGALGAMA